MLAVDLMSSVKVGTIRVLLEPTRKKKKSLISRMFDLESEKNKMRILLTYKSTRSQHAIFLFKRVILY